MQIQIQFINANVEDKGKYKQAEIAYKDLVKGQVSSKKLMSFNNPLVYKTLVDAKNGEIYTIDMQKNDKGYWDWTKAETATSVDTNNAAPPSKGTIAPKSTYETPEERAQRQVLIVRQSSLANAIDYMTATGSIKKATAADVTFCAQEFYDWVFGNKPIVKLEDLPVNDSEDDIPM